MAYSPEQLNRYRASAQRFITQRQQRQQARQQQGWQVARQAASILKQTFGATHVYLFGSMLTLHRLHGTSDVDLAVMGLADDRYLQAVAQLLDLSDFAIDLIQVEYAAPSLRAVIAQQGVPL